MIGRERLILQLKDRSKRPARVDGQLIEIWFKS